MVAIGSPFGLESTVTSGIVSALDRPVDVGSRRRGQQHDVPGDPDRRRDQPRQQRRPAGRPGRPRRRHQRLDPDRELVEPAEQGGSIGLGFAIPIDEVMPIVDQMVKGETPTHARLGISVSDVADPAPGAERRPRAPRSSEVSAGSTAADAGLRKGDVITKVDDQLITGADSLVATIRSYRPGDKVTVTYQQRTATSRRPRELGSSDSDAGSTEQLTPGRRVAGVDRPQAASGTPPAGRPARSRAGR